MYKVVYIAFRGTTPVYVGITKQVLGKRLGQHNYRGKNFDKLLEITPPLPRKLAMAIETTIIIANPHFENQRLSIGRENPIFNAAMTVAGQWMQQLGVQLNW
jgi:hypothetical protein